MRPFLNAALTADDKIVTPVQPEPTELATGDQCSCPDPYTFGHPRADDDFDGDALDADSNKMSSTLAEQSILFENAMQNTIFVRRVEVKKPDAEQTAAVQPGLELISDARRRRRDLQIEAAAVRAAAAAGGSFEGTTAAPSGSSTTADPNATATGADGAPLAGQHMEFPGTGTPPRIGVPKPTESLVSKQVNGTFVYVYERPEGNQTFFTLRNLRHFTTYAISVRVCRIGTTGKTCSEEMTVEPRTQKLKSADVALNLRASEMLSSAPNYTVGSVDLVWDPPALVNGIIVSYTIRYQRNDVEHSKGTELCLSHTLLNNYTTDYVLRGLENGNYSFWVMATSLAGPGQWSEPVSLYIDVSIALGFLNENLDV